MVSVPLNVVMLSVGEGLVDQQYTVNDDSFIHVFGSSWSAQTFTPALAHTVTKVYIKMAKEGSPGVCTVSIRATASSKPTGGDLASGTRNLDTLSLPSGGTWVDFDLGSGTALSASVEYAIVVRTAGVDTDNDGQWRADATSSAYSGGNRVNSSTAGATWDTPNPDFDHMFKEATG